MDDRVRIYVTRLVFILVMLLVGGDVESAYAVQAFEDFKREHAGSEVRLLDSGGKPLQSSRVDTKIRQLDWVSLRDVSASAQAAILRAEDRRFFSHTGTDWWALGKAGVSNLLGKSRRGASTITMQVSAWVFASEKRSSVNARRRTWLEKVEQIRDAKLLEEAWSKEQILEVYLNLVDFRGEARGISAATRLFFNKAPLALDLPEASLLAATIRNPSANRTKVLARACGVLATLNSGVFCEASLSSAAEKYFARSHSDPAPTDWIPHLTEKLRRDRLLVAGKELRLSIRLPVQSRVFEILRSQLVSIREKGVMDGAALVVERKTGAVLAYVGSIGSGSNHPFVDGVLAKRQAGSTLKPFFYSEAFQSKRLVPESPLEDRPISLPVSTGLYQPENHDREYRGWVPASMALASSLNVPAVRVLDLIGVGTAHGLLGRLGFSDLRAATDYGPSMALGSVDVSLWDLTGAYTTLANGGVSRELNFGPDASPVARAGSRIFSEEAVAWTARILSDRGFRSSSFGLDNSLSQPFWVAAKTGTSKDMRDNWCMGFDDRYVVGVWVGNFDGRPMKDVTGVTGAAPAWAEIFRLLKAKDSENQMPKWVARHPFPEAPVQDVGGGSGPRFGRILSPVNGEWIARDPDISPGHERLRVRVDGVNEAAPGRLVLEGQSCIPGRESCRFLVPVPGIHELKWESAEGRVIDRVEFTVRH